MTATTAMTVKEAAALWNISERRVSDLCKKGRISGAYKEGNGWVLPADAQKPADARIKSGAYIKSRSAPDSLRPLPVGVSDYRTVAKEYYYVDKTMMLKDIIDESPGVFLFTRPRRFGKTLNMNMLCTFFEKTDEDTSVYFCDKMIWKQGKKYRQHQGRYPVIFITFKEVRKDTWDKTLSDIAGIIAAEYGRHGELADSPKIHEKDYYKKIAEGSADCALLTLSLFMLAKMLHKHHGTAPVLVIDGYDTPVCQGYSHGFYNEAVYFIRSLFSDVMKDSGHLSYCFVTGIFQAAREKIFGGLANLRINSVLDNRYGGYFGFTPDEVMAMARYYGAQDRYGEICGWYDGYMFGNTEVFNPHSVIAYLGNGCQPGAYWQSTGKNDVIGEILSELDGDTSEKFVSLLDGETVVSSIDTDVVYPRTKTNPTSVFSFLLAAGYLKAVGSEIGIIGDFICKVAIPNKELSFLYRKEILQKFEHIISPVSAAAIQEALYTGDLELLQKSLKNLLLASAGCFDASGGKFFHSLMLGMSAAFEPYGVYGGKEPGENVYDIQMIPEKKNLPGIIIELKSGENCNGDMLKKMAQDAWQGIEDKKYGAEFNSAGIEKIIRFGIAFSGKNVAVVVG